ncbi:MAG: hypothetical protein ACHQ6U_04530 [Thermodesulfobacteriota bacterium]|jgi:hypothetical protein
MEESNVTLDSYIRKIDDQEMKGLLLKLKNELRKPDAAWEPIKSILESINLKNSEVFGEVALLLILK